MKIASIFTISAVALAFAAMPTGFAAGEPLDISVGGYYTQSVQLVDAPNRDGNNIEDEVIAQDAEIHFKGKTVLDNGTELGIRVELEASNSDDQIDEHYVYLKGDWGKLILGAENGVGHLMQVRPPRFVPGLKMFDNSVTDDVFEDAYDVLLCDDNADSTADRCDEINDDGEITRQGDSIIDDAHMSTKLEHISGDANKLSFMTPRVGGLQLGVSYAPNNADKNGGENNAGHTRGTGGANDQATQEDIIELGVSLKGTARNIGYKLSYTTVEGDTVAQDAVKPRSTSIGLALQYGNWLIGGNQSTYEDLHEVDPIAYAQSEKIETVSYAVKYKMGDSHFGIGFTEGEEYRYEPRSDSFIIDFGDDEEEGGTRDNADVRDTADLGHRPKTSYEELMIGGGTKLSKGISLGYYYTKSEASHETVTGTPTVIDADTDSDPQVVGRAEGSYATSIKDDEVSAIGVTLSLRF